MSTKITKEIVSEFSAVVNAYNSVLSLDMVDGNTAIADAMTVAAGKHTPASFAKDKGLELDDLQTEWARQHMGQLSGKELANALNKTEAKLLDAANKALEPLQALLDKHSSVQLALQTDDDDTLSVEFVRRSKSRAQFPYMRIGTWKLSTAGFDKPFTFVADKDEVKAHSPSGLTTVFSQGKLNASNDQYSSLAGFVHAMLKNIGQNSRYSVPGKLAEAHGQEIMFETVDQWKSSTSQVEQAEKAKA